MDDLVLGGEPTGDRLPEHRLKADCPAGGNRANGARVGNLARTRAARRLRPDRFF